ncbi:pyrin-like [Plectropomus leopardus]|uniref:pyrin-like n=1 Tax=Plectropomus leopardus TaxID=160734 RepID=UPI001C4B4026|nr:pyrin-like [Plectropomus leopardus]XP_042367428.1 pyrin-like [Plectropomus leopardus]
MAKFKQELWKSLQDLREEEFENFKWFLKEDDILEGLSGIPVAQLEKAKRQDVVDLMVQKYQGPGALKVAMNVLENINRNDLVQRLQNFHLEPKHGAKREEYNKKKPELEWVRQFAVDVTLDPKTAHPHLILSDDGKQVGHGDVRKNLPNNPERFNKCVNILGKQGFSSGKFYFEVQVKGKTAWGLGVAKESIKRKVQITACPENGYWTIMLRNEEYEANDDDPVHLSLNHRPQRVGVFVDHDKGLVFFYDADTGDVLYSFTGCSFTEKIYPFLTPFTNDHGANAAPLIISPVNYFGDQEEQDRKKAELLSVQQFAVEVTLDPKTAHPNLVLSDDNKQVYHGDVRKKLPNNPERFYRCVNILGKQSFSSGRFYFEVQVKGKTAWTVGVAKESIERKGRITLDPKYGFFTVHFENGDECQAIDDPLVHLPLTSHPQKIGVFVDYNGGLVSFYDVKSAALLYTFTGCSFNEKIYPFFSPCTNDKGINSAPLIVCPVNQND